MDIRVDWERFVCVWVKEFLLASSETRFTLFFSSFDSCFPSPSGDVFVLFFFNSSLKFGDYYHLFQVKSDPSRHNLKILSFISSHCFFCFFYISPPEYQPTERPSTARRHSFLIHFNSLRNNNKLLFGS